MRTPLQQEIGHTERTLAALLAERVLADSPFASMAEWVVANTLSAGPSAIADLRNAVVARSRDVDVALERMSVVGLLVREGGRVRLSDEGRAALHAARVKTSYVASRIDDAVSATGRDAAVRVLATVRQIATGLRESGIPVG
ncbi:hypothetical protein [Microbacterium sp. XT11]|uniref:hypothetical protein n=1 Tax=Microbacterium sp. XT11 TaxID=367477 RepID=UPI000833A98B|nr:hypothetical protein [Microbacterium sp. XT11]